MLLDSGGVFFLPDPARVLGAFARAECDVDPSVLTEAHYRAAAGFTTESGTTTPPPPRSTPCAIASIISPGT